MRSMRAVLALAAGLAGCGESSSFETGREGLAPWRWGQWAFDAQHTDAPGVIGQDLVRQLADIVYDPLVPEAQAATGGDLLAHYQVPLVQGDWVFMESKSGTYSLDSYATQSWSEDGYRWIAGVLTKVWTFHSDWKAAGSAREFWEPVFHATLAGDRIYVPGAGGTLIALDAHDGRPQGRINPFTGIDPATYTASPITLGPDGSLYYNVVKLARPGAFYAADAVNSWLVRVSPAGKITKVSYSALTPNAPPANARCQTSFGEADALPWPPSPTAVPATSTCGLQRVALNIAPAVARDGTIYSVTRAHFSSRDAYLVAVSPALAPRWSASLRDRFEDGCGVPISHGGTLPPNGAPGGCRQGALLGVDPETNRPGGGRVLDDSSSTPVIAPDGSVFYGAYTRYNYAQGHLMHFASDGRYLGAYPFGWDVTPAIREHDAQPRGSEHRHSYSVIIKDNHYSGLGSYCDDEKACPSDRTASNPESPEAYFVTQLDPALGIEWKFQSTNTQSCTRDAQGQVTCVSDHPHGFEWCVNAPVVDARGMVYANSEDGWLYAIEQGGTLKRRIFQNLAIGAAYTPASLGADGRVYSQNDGHMFVVAQ